ncbi:MAG: hypothetical protein JNJ54_19425 [Myxococcaceae bacterium]|nr:hypothetical protein [Myxococcaceae bacterium]
MDATEAAVHFARALQGAGIPHAIGGAIAYGFFGAARGTHDVDLNVFTAGETAPEALRVLIAAGLSIDLDEASTSARERGDARGRFQGLPVVLFLSSIPVHERAARRLRRVTLHGVPIDVLAPEDTAVFKMLFFRGKDLVDVEPLLALMGTSLDRASVRRELVEVVGEDDYRVRKWDELVQALG